MLNNMKTTIINILVNFLLLFYDYFFNYIFDFNIYIKILYSIFLFFFLISSLYLISSIFFMVYFRKKVIENIFLKFIIQSKYELKIFSIILFIIIIHYIIFNGFEFFDIYALAEEDITKQENKTNNYLKTIKWITITIGSTWVAYKLYSWGFLDYFLKGIIEIWSWTPEKQRARDLYDLNYRLLKNHLDRYDMTMNDLIALKGQLERIPVMDSTSALRYRLSQECGAVADLKLELAIEAVRLARTAKNCYDTLQAFGVEMNISHKITIETTLRLVEFQQNF